VVYKNCYKTKFSLKSDTRAIFEISLEGTTHEEIRAIRKNELFKIEVREARDGTHRVCE